MPLTGRLIIACATNREKRSVVRKSGFHTLDQVYAQSKLATATKHLSTHRFLGMPLTGRLIIARATSREKRSFLRTISFDPIDHVYEHSNVVTASTHLTKIRFSDMPLRDRLIRARATNREKRPFLRKIGFDLIDHVYEQSKVVTASKHLTKIRFSGIPSQVV